MGWDINVGKTMSCLPPMTGNGNHSVTIPHRKMVMTGGWFTIV